MRFDREISVCRSRSFHLSPQAGRGKGRAGCRASLVEALAQLVANDLARSGARDLRDEPNDVWNLIGRKTRATVREERLGLQRASGARHDEEGRHLTQELMRNTDDGAIEHI